jgi:hypothetical protein
MSTEAPVIREYDVPISLPNPDKADANPLLIPKWEPIKVPETVAV